jgi:hypothetical protein
VPGEAPVTTARNAYLARSPSVSRARPPHLLPRPRADSGSTDSRTCHFDAGSAPPVGPLKTPTEAGHAGRLGALG